MFNGNKKIILSSSHENSKQLIIIIIDAEVDLYFAAGRKCSDKLYVTLTGTMYIQQLQRTLRTK